MSGDPVRVEAEDGVVTLTLSRPGVRNALTAEVAGGLRDALADLEGGDTRCVVVEGEGDAFCAGGDVNAMLERQSGDLSLDDAVRHVIQDTGRTVQRLAECEFPTVAKVDGTAVGAGATLALACDLQVMRADAAMGFAFRNVGLAVDSGTAHLLPRVVGDNVARELVFTGEMLDADRAADLGLVNHVYPVEEFEERAADLVETVASGPPVALRTSKRLLRRAPELSLSAAVEHEAGAQAAVLDSADHEEGVRAFLERRAPEFEGE
ncbi:MAG: enoyl-CoA hydratase/isomerase family protein [Haloferacaceae archaeon]